MSRLLMMRRRGAPTSGGYKAKVLADSPLAYWRLGESVGTTAVDETGANTGTYVGGVTLGVPGAVAGNTAAAFDGVNGHVSTTWAGITGGGQRTIEFWMKATTNTGGYATMFGQGPNTSGSRFDIRVEGTSIRVEVSGGFRMWEPNVLNGEWRHVAVVLPVTNGSTSDLLCYVDGIQALAVGTGSMAINTFGSPGVGIGRSPAFSDRYFAGALDEAAVYPTALSAGRIAAHYAARNT